MKKVVVSSLLACAVSFSGLTFAYAQAPAASQPGQTPGAAPASGGAAQCPPMPDAEYKSYTDAINQTQPQQKAAALEAYLTAFPNSCVKQATLQILMVTYSQIPDVAKTLATADRILQLEPNNLQALYVQALLGRQSADLQSDPAAKQAALDAAAAAAQKGLNAPKPASMSDADYQKLKPAATTAFYGAIAQAALNRKDSATAIDAYKKELASVPVAQTQTPGPLLQDTYYLGLAYMQANPPDYLSCAFYTARFVALAPEPFKTQYGSTPKYCYHKFHGNDDGYDQFVAAAQANLNPPEGLFATIKPAPTAADIVNQVIQSTPDLGTLAVSDKEFILQNGTPDQAEKVWDTVKGKSVQIPDALVIASTPTQIQVAVSDDAKQSKTADFTFNLKPMDEAKTAAEKKQQDAIAAATAVGQTVALQGTYDSYTPKPIMITMSDGEVVLPKAKAPAHAPVHHTTARKK
ncbi:MAG TPA: hypothetical protein VHU44_05630 [Acidobacteriaceae bacterium]|nr:hypothetical protein [Acidobacteriaceae bacterium]